MKSPRYTNRDLIWCVVLLIAGSWCWSLTLYAKRQGLNDLVCVLPAFAASCALLGAGFFAPFQSKRYGVFTGLVLGLLGVCLWMGLSEFLMVATVLFVAFCVRPAAPPEPMKTIQGAISSTTDGITNAAGLYAAGIIGPGEFWIHLEAMSGGDDVAAALDSCLPGIRQLVRRIFCDRPWQQTPEESAFRAAAREWCSRQ